MVGVTTLRAQRQRTPARRSCLLGGEHSGRCRRSAERGAQRAYHGSVGRPAKYSEDQIIDAAVGLVAEGGPTAATVPAIAERLGAPSGSIYHRFASRDLILAHAWLRGVRASQGGFISQLTDPVPGSGVAAALHLPNWVRNHLPEAQVLLLYRRQDLAAQWPEELGDELDSLNDGINNALRTYTRWLYGRATKANLETVTFALIDIPYGGIRRYLTSGRPPPTRLDALISAAVTQLLGDQA